MEEKRTDARSTAGFTAAMLIFGTIGIFRRYIPVSSPLLAFVRGLLGTLFLAVLAALRKKKLLQGMGAAQMAGYAVLGAMIGFNWILLFEAYNYTSVATATLCYYMEPTIIILASPKVFGEKLTRRKALCAVIAIAGMVLVSGAADSGLPRASEAKGILFGLGAALLYAFVVIMNKKLPPCDPYEKTVVQLASAALVLVPYLLVTEDLSSLQLNGTVVLLLLIVGFIHTGLAYVLYFGSMGGLKAQSIAILSYLDPITALLLSALILHEAMSPAAMLGAVMILGAAALSELKN